MSKIRTEARFPRWILYVALRFATADSRGRSALTTLLSTLGIALGVTALTVILAVMNGFQLGYIESILEVSSAHARVSGPVEQLDQLTSIPGVRSVYTFAESQTLFAGNNHRQQGVLLRSLPADIAQLDPVFSKAVQPVSGRFSLDRTGTVLLGSELARSLGVGVGDTVTVVAVSGGADTSLFPDQGNLLTVRGLFRTGYLEIDSTYAFISHEDGVLLLGGIPLTAAVKLNDIDKDGVFLSRLQALYPELKAESWRSFNRAFFGALRVEKNMLMLLVVLIFVVVTVNIYHGMRRSVYERREEIGVLKALGGSPWRIQTVFLIGGLGIGLAGSLSGLLAGLLLASNINGVFSLAESSVNGFNSFLQGLLFREAGQSFTIFSPSYFYILEVPVRIIFAEVFAVFCFGVFSSTMAAWWASRSILSVKSAEVLHYE